MSATGVSIRASKRVREEPRNSVFFEWFKRFTQVVLAIALLAGLCVFAFNSYRYFTSPKNFPITAAKVDGRFQYLNRDIAQSAVLQHAQQGFFGMDVDALHAEVVAMPWVADASVHRVWPQGITLTVIEHQPVARWNDSGILTETGVVIEPSQLKPGAENATAWESHFASLPYLHSEGGRPAVIWGRFVQADKALRSLGVVLRGLHSDRRNAITLVLDSGVTVRLGRNWFDERLNSLVSVYTRYLAPQIDAISYVDFRYPNGFATGQRTSRGS